MEDKLLSQLNEIELNDTVELMVSDEEEPDHDRECPHHDPCLVR